MAEKMGSGMLNIRLGVVRATCRSIPELGRVIDETLRAREREDVLEELARRLLKARESGMGLSDMQAMAREAGVEI